MSIVKKVSLLSLVAALCVSPVLAKKEVKKASAQTRGFSANCNTGRKGACDSDFEKFKNCIEKLLSEKFRKLDCDLDKELAGLNETISYKVESLNICLKEFIAKQIRDEEERLKCWFTCRLDKTEHDLEEFICHKFDCLIEFLCAQFKQIDCDLAVLTCKVDDIDADVDCTRKLLECEIGKINQELLCIATALEETLLAVGDFVYNHIGVSNPEANALKEALDAANAALAGCITGATGTVCEPCPTGDTCWKSVV